MRMRPFVGVALFCAASCGNLTCSQDKKDSIKHNNIGTEALKSKSYTVAQKEFETALTLDPENHLAAYHLGEAYFGEKNYDKAADAYSKAVRINDKETMYHYKLGKSYFESQKWDLARASLEKALQINNRLYKAHWLIGRIHSTQDRPKEAASAWSESCKLDPGFGKPFYDLGRLYYVWGFLDEAIAVLEQGAQYARDPEDATNILYQLGLAYQDKKQLDKAVDAYAKAIAKKADNVEARLMAGMAYADMGNKAKAKEYLDDFIKLGGGGQPFNIQNAHERLLRMAADSAPIPQTPPPQLPPKRNP